jgi:hypothetical protein
MRRHDCDELHCAAGVQQTRFIRGCRGHGSSRGVSRGLIYEDKLEILIVVPENRSQRLHKQLLALVGATITVTFMDLPARRAS